MAKIDEILAEIRVVKTNQENLYKRLYGSEGDMPLIRRHLEKLNGVFLDHERRITRNKFMIIGAIILASGGGGSALVTKLMELW